MTLKDIEHGFELHEKRLERVDQRLDRLASAMESHDKRLTRVENNLVVQGELLNRLDQRLDRMAMLVEEDREGLRVMQAAMTSLFQRMDAFIRGLERNDGHPKPGDE